MSLLCMDVRTWHAIDMAVTTYFASNISATINQGIGPNPISKKDTKAIPQCSQGLGQIMPLLLRCKIITCLTYRWKNDKLKNRKSIISIVYIFFTVLHAYTCMCDLNYVYSLIRMYIYKCSFYACIQRSTHLYMQVVKSLYTVHIPIYSYT